MYLKKEQHRRESSARIAANFSVSNLVIHVGVFTAMTSINQQKKGKLIRWQDVSIGITDPLKANKLLEYLLEPDFEKLIR
tara:strand:+ start:788 stop:1027 length:240 start_codon:yes stop_codon:yes gene_type:complete